MQHLLMLLQKIHALPQHEIHRVRGLCFRCKQVNDIVKLSESAFHVFYDLTVPLSIVDNLDDVVLFLTRFVDVRHAASVSREVL